MTPFAIVWLRNDLRTYDNLALIEAMHTGLPVIALFIATPDTWQEHQMAPIKQDLLRRRVKALELELAELGIPLISVEASNYADTKSVIAVLQQGGAEKLFAQREYELREMARDHAITQQMQQSGGQACWLDTQCVMPPGSLLNQSGDMYKVFTPFKRAWLARFRQTGVSCLNKPQQHVSEVFAIAMRSQQAIASETGFTALASGDHSSQQWPVAEVDVLQRLRNFCRETVEGYATERDYPAKPGTSQLSPYFAIGVISAQQALARLQLEAGDALWQDGQGAAVWLSELIWREFYKHILVAYPELIKHRPFQTDTNAIQWGNHQPWFAAWCEGRTGYPIVDAAMRQLNSTGWMHNRLRMIAASFLVKDLQIDWRWGEAYFMSKLIDGDFAANNGGWQWAASTGTDAAPYFRIFNPVTQSEKFDPQGDFICQYIPELRLAKNIHWPHPLPANVEYAKPIVDHAKARLITLAMFKAIKENTANLSSPSFDLLTGVTDA